MVQVFTPVGTLCQDGGHLKSFSDFHVKFASCQIRLEPFQNVASYAVVRFNLLVSKAAGRSNSISRKLVLKSIMKRISLYIRVIAVSQLKFFL